VCEFSLVFFFLNIFVFFRGAFLAAEILFLNVAAATSRRRRSFAEDVSRGVVVLLFRWLHWYWWSHSHPHPLPYPYRYRYPLLISSSAVRTQGTCCARRKNTEQTERTWRACRSREHDPSPM